MVRAPCALRVCWPLQVQNTDSIHWRTAPSDRQRCGFVFAVGAQEARAEPGHDLLELFAGKALVGDDGIALKCDVLEHLSGDDTFGLVAAANAKAIGMPSGAHSR